jgi:hypothetical protein
MDVKGNGRDLTCSGSPRKPRQGYPVFGPRLLNPGLSEFKAGMLLTTVTVGSYSRNVCGGSEVCVLPLCYCVGPSYGLM